MKPSLAGEGNLHAHRLFPSFRRRFLLGSAAAIVLGLPRLAFAGSYLDRAGLLLTGAVRDNNVLRLRMNDKELAKVVSAIAAARSDVARKMEVPASVAKAHPHLLLLLNHSQSGALAAVEQNFKSTVEELEAARREDKMFRSLLKELGYTIAEDLK